MYHSASINLQWYVVAASAQTEAKQPEPLRLVWRKLQYNDEPMEVHISTGIIQMVCWVASVNPILSIYRSSGFPVTTRSVTTPVMEWNADGVAH